MRSRADESEQQQRDRMPIGDGLQHAFADMVFQVQHEDPPWFQHTPALGPDRHVQHAVLLAPLQHP